MSHLTKRRPARCLRFECLERRSLLAAGIFDFTTRDVDDGGRVLDWDKTRQLDQRANHDQGRAVQEIRNRNRIEQGPFDFGRHRDSGPSESGNRIARLEIRINQFEDLNRHEPPIPDRTVTDQIQHAVSPPLNETFSNLPSESIRTQPRADNQPITPLVLPSATSQPVTQESGEEAQATPRTTEVQLTSLPITITDREIPTDDGAEAHPTQTLASAAQFAETQGVDDPILLNPSNSAVSGSSSNADLIEPLELGGLIELTPLGQWQTLEEPYEPASESWHLDREILPRLSETIEVGSAELVETVDTVVDQLFDEGGGMVAIDQVQLPAGYIEIQSAFTKVQVESTVVLYRSLDLIASSDISMPSSQLNGPILDSIMATLGDVAESQTQPVDDPSKSRLSAIAYPIVAIAATGAAFSARQKSKPNSHSKARKRVCDT